MTQEVQTNDLKEMVDTLIPEDIGKDRQKAPQSTYPHFCSIQPSKDWMMSPSTGEDGLYSDDQFKCLSSTLNIRIRKERFTSYVGVPSPSPVDIKLTILVA